MQRRGAIIDPSKASHTRPLPAVNRPGPTLSLCELPGAEDGDRGSGLPLEQGHRAPQLWESQEQQPQHLREYAGAGVRPPGARTPRWGRRNWGLSGVSPLGGRWAGSEASPFSGPEVGELINRPQRAPSGPCPAAHQTGHQTVTGQQPHSG